MEGTREIVDGPITPFKPGKDDQVIEYPGQHYKMVQITLSRH